MRRSQNPGHLLAGQAKPPKAFSQACQVSSTQPGAWRQGTGTGTKRVVWAEEEGAD